MDFTIVLLIVFMVITILGIIALLSPKKDKYPHSTSNSRTGWRNAVFKMIVPPPYLYRDLWNPLRRLYWPEEQQPDNRASRRLQKRRRRRR